MKINIIGTQPSANALREVVATLDSTQEVMVYWGAKRQAPPPPPDGTLVLNGVACRKNSVEQLTLMRDAGLSVPSFWTELDQAIEIETARFPTFGRRLYHTRGNDIVGSGYKVRRNGTTYFNPNWINRDFWVEVVPPEVIINEWRIHVFQGRVIARGLKVQTGPPVRKQLVRNRANGWTLSHVEDPPQHIKDAARKAVAAVGYNFGAVDILEIDQAGGYYLEGYYLLEVNSAPALLSTYTMDAYVKAFMKIAKGGYRKWYRPVEER